MSADGGIGGRGPLRCVVTGGSLGIGAAITRGLLAAGCEVVVGCRDVARAWESLGQKSGGAVPPGRLTVERLDVSSLAEVRRFAARVAGDRPGRGGVDVLLHNAGASFPRRRTSVDGLELSFATNTLGPHALTRALLPALRASRRGARVIHMGSLAQLLVPLAIPGEQGRLARGPYVHELAYARSKRALYELSEAWAEALAPHGIAVTCTHPGLVDTPGVAAAFPRYHQLFGAALPSPAEGADTALWLALSPSAPRGGLWWRRARQPAQLFFPPTPAARRARLWDACERLASMSVPADGRRTPSSPGAP